MYRVDLDLDPTQVKQLKQLALDKDLPVRGLVTRLVVEATSGVDKKKEKEGTK